MDEEVCVFCCFSGFNTTLDKDLDSAVRANIWLIDQSFPRQRHGFMEIFVSGNIS
ncbi:MAG: hypothetical protein QXS91_01040 [Candidatus Anstonellales archaeon]